MSRKAGRLRPTPVALKDGRTVDVRVLAATDAEALGALRGATEWMLAAEMTDRLAGSVPYLRAFALVLGGHYLLRAASVDGADAERCDLPEIDRHVGC